MEIKIEAIKKISPGIPKVIHGNDIDTKKTIMEGGITYAVYEAAFTGRTGQSGQVLLFENRDMYEPENITEYFVATVIDSISVVRDASVDGKVEYGIGYYTGRSKLISTNIRVVSAGGSVETAINWSDLRCVSLS
jgi:hypothetical protein